MYLDYTHLLKRYAACECLREAAEEGHHILTINSAGVVKCPRIKDLTSKDHIFLEGVEGVRESGELPPMYVRKLIQSIYLHHLDPESMCADNLWCVFIRSLVSDEDLEREVFDLEPEVIVLYDFMSRETFAHNCQHIGSNQGNLIMYEVSYPRSFEQPIVTRLYIYSVDGS